MYGFSLTAWNFGKNELRRVCEPRNPSVCFNVPVLTTDFGIGVPGEAVGTAGSAGAVHVFYGSSAANGLDFFSEQTLTHSNTRTGTSQAGEFFGGTVY